MTIPFVCGLTLHFLPQPLFTVHVGIAALAVAVLAAVYKFLDTVLD